MLKNIIEQNKTFIAGIGILLVAIILLFLSNGTYLLSLQTKLIGGKYQLVSTGRMKIMKEKGCIYDGLLTPRYNRYFNKSLDLLKRSRCKYIHRSIETWNIPPDFTEINRRINVIKQQTNKNFIFGLFIAESIDVTKSYYDPIEKRYYSFRKMCSPGTLGAWGKNTCKPSFEKSEYRKYINSITRRAIDSGVRDFTFGQIYYQDPHWKNNIYLAQKIISQMKEYAKEKNVEISVGAQTNTIDNEQYLKNFDYITGGIGQHVNGTIETGHPCWSYYFQRDGYCWALLWNEKYKNKANNILVYLDWNNSVTDDIHRFTRMSREQRAKFLAQGYDFFLHQDIGFLMPLGEVLGNVGSGCFGPSREFYSASSEYSCKDEDSINNILSGGNLLPVYNEFISQVVPLQMEAGEKKLVSIKIKNKGFRKWSTKNNIRLGSWSPQDNKIWGIDRVNLLPGEIINYDEVKEFVFPIIAPQKTGKYNFQWKMLIEGEKWFGEPTDKIIIDVLPVGSFKTNTF